ncbi:hypothetical protein HJFPF1_09315 [Paramyrothecium foliicola]|nr:hypothetical protein HJFPF1_09315 [Paramyrothecium foliicola]
MYNSETILSKWDLHVHSASFTTLEKSVTVAQDCRLPFAVGYTNMRSSLVVAAALLARCWAEPIQARSDDGSSNSSIDEKAKTTSVQVSSFSVIVVTVEKIPLTTTFTPPATCTEERLTMLSSPRYQIWLNEPMPVSGSKLDDCYPSEFMSGYTSLPGTTGSVAPLMSPLVCPQGWWTVGTWDVSYIACCQSGWNLALPTTAPRDPKRSAYGGTCYSNFEAGQTATVTKYDDKEVTETGIFSASTSLDQAYGHPIDGIALDLMLAGSIDTQAPETSAPASDADPNTENGSGESRGLSGGAIAGIVVGSLAAISFIILGAFFFVRRRAKQQGHEQIGISRDQPSQQEDHGNNKPLPDVYALKEQPANGSVYTASSPVYPSMDGRSEVATATSPGPTVASPVSELGGRQRHELATVDYAELDGGYNRHEI